MEASPRIELGYTDLQSAASPLRHEAVLGPFYLVSDAFSSTVLKVQLNLVLIAIKKAAQIVAFYSLWA